ncbi:hypothetical protein GLOIN_2v1459336 [Rhizophagus clarus]|uniref:Uncharacterized protein n=1 Tax=Rhizophagus clarus TaxID=94130 RepID=A0A8H3QF74_9GLOM|nr:hypothetical protein GLOIN_2v1459336 [Rhizophagus clarus]
MTREWGNGKEQEKKKRRNGNGNGEENRNRNIGKGRDYIRSLDIKIRSKDMFWKYITKTWNETTLETCIKLIEIMSERVEDIIKAKEDYT